MCLSDLIIVYLGPRPTEGHDQCARCDRPTCTTCPLHATQFKVQA